MRITDALLGEHGVFYAQFDRLDEDLPTEDAAEVAEQAALLAAALVSHAKLEDELLFERMAAAGADHGLMAVMVDEHESIADHLARAQATRDAGRARQELREAVALARDHFAREERLAFPLAESLLGDAVLRALGAEWARRRDVWVEAAAR